jgi:hypothetical protein
MLHFPAVLILELVVSAKVSHYLHRLLSGCYAGAANVRSIVLSAIGRDNLPVRRAIMTPT